MLVVVALLLAPVAVITAWARIQLVDTDQFVATFAPLAEEPAVQAYIGDQVTAAIEEQVDIPALTSDLFDGIKQLDLPPRAEHALGLLEAPATQGLQSLVSGIVDRIVESPAFADIWARRAHPRATRHSWRRCRGTPTPRSRSAATARCRCSSAPSSRR